MKCGLVFRAAFVLLGLSTGTPLWGQWSANTNGIPGYYLPAGSYVGVGIQPPQTNGLFWVNGNIFLTSIPGGMRSVCNGNDSGCVDFNPGGVAGAVRVASNSGGNQLWLATSGNVGVGNANPTSNLDLSASSDTTGFKVGNSGGGSYGFLRNHYDGGGSVFMLGANWLSQGEVNMVSVDARWGRTAIGPGAGSYVPGTGTRPRAVLQPSRRERGEPLGFGRKRGQWHEQPWQRHVNGVASAGENRFNPVSDFSGADAAHGDGYYSAIGFYGFHTKGGDQTGDLFFATSPFPAPGGQYTAPQERMRITASGLVEIGTNEQTCATVTYSYLHARGNRGDCG